MESTCMAFEIPRYKIRQNRTVWKLDTFELPPSSQFNIFIFEIQFNVLRNFQMWSLTKIGQLVEIINFFELISDFRIGQSPSKPTDKKFHQIRTICQNYTLIGLPSLLFQNTFNRREAISGIELRALRNSQIKKKSWR